MIDDNPYAPPVSPESQTPSALTWQLDGANLLVKNAVALPMVDLETGEHTAEMKCIRRVYQKRGSFSVWNLAIAVIAFQLANRYHLGPYVIFGGLFVVLLLVNQAKALRSNPARRLYILEFAGPGTVNGRMARRKWRLAIGWLGFLGVMAFLLSVPGTPAIRHLAVPGLLAIAGSVLWEVLDRPKAKASPGPDGWLRISPIHPDAFAFLSEIQRNTHAEASAPGLRKRLVRTTYFHRYPVGMLLGKRKNPLVIFNVMLAKLLRSHQLKRETYHFSEAEPRSATELSPPLQGQINSWIDGHPGWTYHTGDHLTFPDGDVIVERANLASPGLEHLLYLIGSWNLALPEQRHFQFVFCTWLADGTRILTYDRTFVSHQTASIHEFKATGNPEQIFQAHLQNCSGRPLDPPRDSVDLLNRIASHHEESDRRLTALGYQSEVREVG